MSTRTFKIDGNTGDTVAIQFQTQGNTCPYIRFNGTTGVFEISNDGTTTSPIPTGMVVDIENGGYMGLASNAGRLVFADDTVDTITVQDASFIANGILNVATATNWQLGSVAYTGSMADLNNLRNDSLVDSLHRHSELSASDGSPNPALQVDASGNVGIGTTAPITNLHVADNGLTPHSGLYSGTTDFIIASGENSGIRLVSSSNSATNPAWLGLTASRGTTQVPLASESGDFTGQILSHGYRGASRVVLGQITFYVDGAIDSGMPGRIVFSTTSSTGTSSTERMRIDSSGYVGIGTSASATGPLQVKTSSSGAIIINATFGSTNLFTVNANTNYTTYEIQPSGGYDHVWTSRTDVGAAAERFRIAGGAATANVSFSNANVGIGTTSPSVKLMVAGTGGASGGSAWVKAISYSSTYTDWRGESGIVIGKSHSGTSGTLATTISGEQIGSITFAGVDSGNNNYTQAAITAVQTGTAISGAWGPTRLDFIAGNSGTAALTVSGTNVGVGTTSPLSLLNVNGSSQAFGAGVTYYSPLHVSSSDSYAINKGGSISLGGYYSTGSNTSTFAKLHGKKETATAGETGGYFALEVAVNATAVMTEMMRVTSSGNVGIGTTAPAAKLEVKDGNVYLTDADVAHGMTGLRPTNAWGAFTPSSDTAGGMTIMGLSDDNAASESNTGLKMVGIIGYPDPTDTVSAVQLLAGKRNGTTGSPGNGWQALGAAETAFQFLNNATALATILGDGKLGLGTVTPTGTLHINDATNGSATVPHLYITHQSYDCRIRMDINASATRYWDIAALPYDATQKYPLAFQYLGANRLYLSSDGYAGLGTGSPLTELHVACTGSSFPRGILIDQYANNAYGAVLTGYKSRHTTVGSHTVVQSGDDLISIRGYGSDGSAHQQAAAIYMNVDGTPGSSIMPGRVSILTSAPGTASPSERLRVNSYGNVGINTTAPTARLHVAGNVAIDDGPELVTNGTFTTDTTGWTAGTNTTLSVSTGYLKVLATGGDYAGYASQLISNLTIGKRYRVTWTFVSKTAVYARVWLGTAQFPNSGFDAYMTGIAMSRLTTSSTTITATATTLGILLHSGGNAANQYCLYDNISVVEVGNESASGNVVAAGSLGSGFTGVPTRALHVLGGGYIGNTSTTLVVNGTFTSDISGWSELFSGASWVSGRLRHTVTSSQSLTSQHITIVTGRRYKLSATVYPGTAATQNISAGNAEPSGTGYQAYGTYSGALSGTYTIEFTATSSDLWVSVGTVDNTGSEKYSEWDDISLVEIGRLGVGIATPVGKIHSSFDGTTIDPSLYSGSYETFIGSGDSIDAGIRLIASGGATVKPGLTFQKVNGTVAAPSVSVLGDSLGAITAQGYSNASRRTAATIEFAVDAAVDNSVSEMPGRIVFSTSADGSATPTERVRIDSSGRVGIGTAAPVAQLDVSSGVQTGSFLLGADTNLTTRTNATTKLGTVVCPHATSAEEHLAVIGGYSTNGGSNVVMLGGGSVFTNCNAATAIYFHTAANNTTLTGTERMRIDSTGNVLIGCTANTFSTQGLTIDQSTYDNEILSLKSSTDVAHGMTSITDANTFLRITKASPSSGGVNIEGFSDDGTHSGLQLSGVIGYPDPTDTVPANIIIGSKQSGTVGTPGTSLQALAAAETALQIRNYSTNLITVLGDGKTGFGTVTPSATLHAVMEDSGTNTKPSMLILRHETSGTAAAGIGVGLELQHEISTGAGVQGAKIYSYSETGSNAATSLALQTNDGSSGLVDRITITSAGYVGVGTASPSVAMEISSATATTVLAVAAGLSGGTGTPGFNTLAMRNTLASPQPVQSDDRIGCIVFRGQYDTTVGHHYNAVGIAGWAENTFSVGSAASYLTFDTCDVSATIRAERMRITSTGKVGIGTTAPANLLHVKNASNTGTATDNTGLNVESSYRNAVLNLNAHSSYDTGVVFYNLGVEKGRIYYNNMNNYMAFQGNGTTEMMRLTSAGYLGVGVTAPNARLHVTDSAYATTALFERSGQTTDSPKAGMRVLVTKTTNMADGFGTLIDFVIQDDSLTHGAIGAIGAVRANSDDTTGDIVIRPSTAGNGIERMRIRYTGQVDITGTYLAPLNLGGKYLWNDGAGNYRTKTTIPASATDGNILMEALP